MTAAAPPLTWRVVAASVRGTAHARAGLPCQDAHAWRALSGGALAIAVADGAGTAAHADAGARAAVRAAIETLHRSSAESSVGSVESVDGSAEGKGIEGWTDAIDRALVSARDAVEAEAARMEVDAREMACTLIVAVVSMDGVAAAQVGDGAVVVAGGDGIRALTTPAHGEFANETVFLTAPGAVEGAQRAAWRRPVEHVAVFTDGLQPLALRIAEREPHAPFFAPLFRFASSIDPSESRSSGSSDSIRPTSIDPISSDSSDSRSTGPASSPSRSAEFRSTGPASSESVSSGSASSDRTSSGPVDADRVDDADGQLAAFLSGPRVAARADDDLTLVLAARCSHA